MEGEINASTQRLCIADEKGRGGVVISLQGCVAYVVECRKQERRMFTPQNTTIL
jgi:hypothetical protein